MTVKKEIQISAKSEAEALEIAQAMQAMSGHFDAKQWKAIAKNMQNTTVRMRVKLLLT
jgi:hypothetical protein